LEHSRFVDYSGREQCLVELYDYRCVTREDIDVIKHLIPSDRYRQVEVGDSIAVYIIDNRIESVQGLLTIWHNKEIACLDKGEGKIWGDWAEEVRLVITDDFEEVEDEDGMTSISRIAYNTHGLRGKYAGGRFYTLFRGEAFCE
jgi:hypothetical protein